MISDEEEVAASSHCHQKISLKGVKAGMECRARRKWGLLPVTNIRPRISL